MQLPVKILDIRNKSNKKEQLSEENKSTPDISALLKRRFFDIVFIIGYLCCLPVGAFPKLVPVFGIIMLLCICICFFDENFYLYTAVFMFMRYKVLIGETPVFRMYSYLVVIKFLTTLPKTKFRIAYLPAIFVMALHCVFVFGRTQGNLRLAMNTIVDVVIIYVVLLKVLETKELTRKFFIALILGGISSGVYGWIDKEMTMDINVRGAGAEKVSRNFGSLGDPNFAGMFYNTCLYSALILKTIPKLLKAVFIAFFAVVILQTASLSAILTTVALGAVLIVLKYRSKSFFILLFLFIASAAALGILLAIPQFREIPAIAGLIIRINEKLSYIGMGRLDLLTTDRSAIWSNALRIFSEKSLFGKLFGGSVITVMYIDTSLISIAIHQSVIQALLNFGIVGTLLIYIPFLGVIMWRIMSHFSVKGGYEGEDVAILRIMMPLCFLIFGMSVDFFIDWSYLFFYFI